MRGVENGLLCVAMLLMTTVGVNVALEEMVCSTTSNQVTIQPEADAFIAGFFSMHGSAANGVGCGDINTMDMQSYEAIRWALDRLNKKDEMLNGEYLTDYFIPGVRIGMIAHDYCSNPSMAVTQAGKLFPQIGAAERECTRNTDKLMLGLMGASSSDDTKELQQFSEDKGLPLVSYTATAPELSDVNEYMNFMRTIPPDGELMKTLVEFINTLDWRYVVVVYTANTYGDGAYRAIRPHLADANICLTSAIAVDPNDVSTTTMDSVLEQVMQTNTTGVIYLGNNLIANGLLGRAEQYPGAGLLQWVVTDSVSLSDKFPNMKYPRGLISVVPSGRKIIEFEDHWVRIDPENPSSENPWFQAMYMDRFKCRLPGQTAPYPDCVTETETDRRNNFVQDQFVEPAVHAVFVYARALKNAHADLCNGVPGMCTALRTLSTVDFYTNYLKSIDFTYGKAERVESLASVSLDPYNAAARVTFTGNDINDPSFEMFNFNNYPYGGDTFKFLSVGTYIRGLLEVLTNRLRFYDEPRDNVLPYIPKSLCPSTPCSPCLGALFDSKYVYIPGDIVINAAFSVHHSGDKPMTCGDFNDGFYGGIQHMEAFIYAINLVNTEIAPGSGRLNGVTLGALGFDDCTNPIMLNHLITEVQRYSRNIYDMNGDNKLDPRTVEAFMTGGIDQRQAVSMADLMNTIKRPMVAAETYTTTLNDFDRFPYFLRANYDYQNLSMAFINVAKREGWKFLQVVYPDDMWGQEAFDVLRRIAAQEGICIVAEFALKDNAMDVVTGLRNRNDVQPVVLFLDHDHFRMFMEGVRMHNITNEFQFLSMVGDSKSAIAGYEDYLNGMLSYEFWTGTHLTNFQNHLQRQDPATYATNPWFKEWYESKMDCSFTPTDTQTQCGTQNMFAMSGLYDYELDTNVMSVIYGVIAIAHGLDATLKQYCGPNYDGLCGDFMNARNKGMDLVSGIIRETNYEIASGAAPTYYQITNERMGTLPFIYYKYDTFFAKVGEYMPSQPRLQFDQNLVTRTVQSSCPGVCMECLYLFGHQKFMYIDGDIIIPGIFDVHYKGASTYSCADMKVQNGFQYTEAFRYALDRVNRGVADVKLNGVTLGGLGFNGCTDPIRASAIVTGMYSGAFPKPGTDLDSKDINTGEFAGWMSYDSESTVNVARILQRHDVPSITPFATTPLLDDKSEYTTFFRTIPSDSVVARAMAQLTHFLGFSYIITINAPEEGSRDAVRVFREYANALGICIGASYEFETDGSERQIVQYINQSSTNVVAVFASPDQHIETMIREIENMRFPVDDRIIFITNQPWNIPLLDAKPSGQSPIAGTISFEMEGMSDLEEFLFFLSDESRTVANSHVNPWWREFYETVKECSLSNDDNACSTVPYMAFSEFSLDHRVIPTINAVYSLAEGVHRTLQTKCGVNYTGVCPGFFSDEDTYETIMAHMDALSFKDITDTVFRFLEREADRRLMFSQFQDSVNLVEMKGYFSSNTLDILDQDILKAYYENIKASCDQCMQCEMESSGIEEFMYSNGQIHIAGLFDIHKEGSTPFTCGEINDVHGFQLMEAFNWALNYVNTNQGIFSDKLFGVTLGSLIFDTCKSPVRSGNLVANYHARNFEVRNGQSRIDPSTIDLYIGPMTSEASIRVADVLREFAIPQIGYGASSMELIDERDFRLFLRTVPADDKQARALISILKKYSFDNIQLVSQNSSVGEHAREEFLRLAPLNRICISEHYIVGQDGMIDPTDANDIINKILTNPYATVVVVIMDDPYTVLKAASANNAIITGGYGFIATDKLGFGVAGYENLVGIHDLVSHRRLITLEVESADYPELDAYLESTTPADYTTNPWFKEYFEYIHNCTVDSQPNAQYPQLCSEEVQGYTRAEGYIQDPYVLYVVNAVFAAALGIHQTILDFCGTSQTYCPYLQGHGEKRELFLENIKKVQFTDRTHQPFYFESSTRSSDRGFHIYEPQNIGMSLHAGAADYYWEDIGSYNDTHFLKMDVTFFPGWNSTCVPGSCQCVFPEYQPSRYMVKPSPNDLNVVFVSDVHHADPDNPLGCGSIDTGSNMQTLLGFLYALEEVNANRDSKFQSSLKLGGIALDTCSNPSRIGQDVYSLLSGEPICGVTNGQQVVPPASVVTYVVRNSANSIAVSSMLSPLEITSLSMSATSVELNDKLEHPYFLRTVPPDNIQAVLVAQIMKKFGWDYVTVVYAENTYGISARDTLLGLVNPDSPEYCFGRTVPMPLSADLEEAKRVIDLLNSRIGAKIVVTFVTSDQVRLLLQATTEKGLNHRFIWIGSDTWANNNQLTDGYEETAAGALTIQIKSEFSDGFKAFVKSLNFTNRKGIPDDWFEEIYQTVHECRILSSVVQKTYTQICSGEEVFTDDMIPNDPFVLHTIIAIYQIANGLNEIQECGVSTSIGVASCLSTLDNRKQTIYDAILNAEHDVLPNDLGDNSFNFKFTAEGYGDIGYNIYNFRRNLTSGQYEYIKIGSSSGELLLDVRDYQSYSFTDRSLPLSRCPIGSECQCEGLDGTTLPFSRQEDGYVVTDEGQYVDPVTGSLVTIDDTPEIADRFRDIWAIIVATLAAIGAFAALCMFVYLLVIYPVRGGTTILGYMLCFAIILMYGLVFAFIVHASTEVCGLRRFSLGFVYSIAYAALFVKLVDCWRTKDKEEVYYVKYNKIGNPWGLFFSACLIVLVQVMINAEWLILEAPGMERVIYNNKLWPRCIPDDFYDEGLILSNVYVMFLIFLCVIVGLLAFGNDMNHWDCRWLTGCVVLTIPAWMVWCLVAALGEYKMRDAAVAIGLLYNATVMLMCGPLRKLYLLNKYQARLHEEEQKSQLAASSQRGDYNSMYGQQYDNMPRLHDGDSVRGDSTMGRDDVFMYEPKS